MDHIGIDVHKRESQIYILGEGTRVDTASLFIERQHETHSPYGWAPPGLGTARMIAGSPTSA